MIVIIIDYTSCTVIGFTVLDNILQYYVIPTAKSYDKSYHTVSIKYPYKTCFKCL